MTDDGIAFEALLEKAGGADFLLDMITFAADRLMAYEADVPVGASRSERTPNRADCRNGTHERR